MAGRRLRAGGMTSTPAQECEDEDDNLSPLLSSVAGAGAAPARKVVPETEFAFVACGRAIQLALASKKASLRRTAMSYLVAMPEDGAELVKSLITAPDGGALAGTGTVR